MDAEQRQAKRLFGVRAVLLRDVDRIMADLLNPNDIPASLRTMGPLVVARIRVAQSQGLDAAAEYADAVLQAAFGPAAIGVVMPGELVGFDRQGRAIDTMAAGASEMYGKRLASGMDPGKALDLERDFWRRAAGSIVHDTARAGLVGLANPESGWAHPQVEGWARVAHAGACEFCRMLAGRGYAYTSKQTALRASDGDR